MQIVRSVGEHLGGEQHEVLGDVDEAGAEDAEREAGEDVGVVALPRPQHAPVLRAVLGERRARREDRTLLEIRTNIIKFYFANRINLDLSPISN